MRKKENTKATTEIKRRDLEKEVEEEQNRHDHERKNPLAIELAIENLANPPEDKIQELNYFSPGLVHALTMLQAYEKQIPRILEQIKDRRYWYLNRYIHRLHMTNKWTQELENKAIEQVKKDIEELDKIDLKQLFAHQLRYSIYQHTRGRKGNLMESLTVVTDSAIQRGTDNSDNNDDYKHPIREQ